MYPYLYTGLRSMTALSNFGPTLFVRSFALFTNSPPIYSPMVHISQSWYTLGGFNLATRRPHGELSVEVAFPVFPNP